MSENPVGRPTVMTPENIYKLEEAWKRDMNDAEACFCAGIAPSSLYEYEKKHPEFSERKKELKNALFIQAKTLIADDLLAGNTNRAAWLLERRRAVDYAVGNKAMGPTGGAVEHVHRLVEVGVDDAKPAPDSEAVPGAVQS